MIKLKDILNSTILIEGRKEDMYNKYKAEVDEDRRYYSGDDGAAVYDYFIDNETIKNTNYKYLPWLMKWFYDRPHDHDYGYGDLLGRVEVFHKLNHLIEKKDLNQYTPDELDSVVDVALKKDKERKEEKERKGTRDVIYEDSRWKIIVPKTHEASCHYGQGTKWCTTMKDNPRYFKQYTEKGILFYFIDKTKTRQENDVMYRIAVNWQWRKGIGGTIVPMNINSSTWFDSTDKGITATHVIPLLPKPMIEAITTYYNNYIEKVNNKVAEPLNITQLTEDIRRFLSGGRYAELVKKHTKSYISSKENINSVLGEVSGVTLSEWMDEDGYRLTISFTDSEIKCNVQLLQRGHDDYLQLVDLTAVDYSKNEEDRYIGGEDYVLSYDKTNNDIWAMALGTVMDVGRGETNDILKDEGSLGVALAPHKDFFTSQGGFRFFVSATVAFISSFIEDILPVAGRKSKETYFTKGDMVYWRARNSSSTFTFRYPPKEGSMTAMLVDATRRNPGITIREFYLESLGKEYPRGHNTQFIGSIIDSGILRVEKGPYGEHKFYLGPNYEAWTEGRLQKYEYR